MVSALQRDEVGLVLVILMRLVSGCTKSVCAAVNSVYLKLQSSVQIQSCNGFKMVGLVLLEGFGCLLKPMGHPRRLVVCLVLLNESFRQGALCKQV